MRTLFAAVGLAALSLLLTAFVGADARADGVRHLEGVVNLNTAAAEELRLLPGVGPSKIRAIIAYRRQRAFRTVEEFARVKGIGHKMVRQLRMHLAVSGPTTAQHVIRADVPPDAVSGPMPVRPPPKLPPPPPRPGAPPSPPARPRPPGPGMSFPTAAANHCPRPR
jgi:competence ComEA-like helix-hairpin-helix protein